MRLRERRSPREDPAAVSAGVTRRLLLLSVSILHAVERQHYGARRGGLDIANRRDALIISIVDPYGTILNYPILC